jgi:DNA-binding SARP family transcriptional activator
MEALWPSATKNAAANNLRQTLHAARRTLSADPAVGLCYVASEGEQIALRPDAGLWVDAHAFEDAAREANREQEPAAYEAALDLYAGELLPEDRYEEWAEDPRARLRSVYISLLGELADLYERRGDLSSTILSLGRLLAEEPANEGAHYYSLMRVYALSGRRGEAISHNGHAEEPLARNLGVEPSASMRALREEIAAGTYPPPEPSAE